MPSLLLAALAFAPPAAGAETYLLRYKFEPNTSLRYEIETASTMVSKIGEVTQTVRNSGSTTQRVDVLTGPAAPAAGRTADDPGRTAGTVRVVSERIRLSMQFDADPPREFDSAIPGPVPDGFEAVASVVGAPLVELTVAAGGEVTKAVSLLPGVGPDADATEAYRDLFPGLPEGRVAVGDSWEERVTTRVREGTGELTKPWVLRRTSTLTGVEDGVATIAVTMTPLPPPVDPHVRQQLVGRCPSGTVTLDVANGRLLSQVAKVDDQVINFRGAGSLLRVTTAHDQRLKETVPTPAPARTALAPKADAN